ncbi:MAG: hypothetical protein H8E55_41870 [Pelagibacterales bacterium]|nr:hypothetical protein [Pelagibacterales bacterium]
MNKKEPQHPAEKYYEDRMNAVEKKGQSYLVKHLNKQDLDMNNRGKQTLAFSDAGKKVLKEQIKYGSLKPEDVRLKLNESGLHTNKNRTIAVRDSFVAKAFNDSLGIKPDYPTQASPEAFGKLAENLERDRQSRGAPTNVKEFGRAFNENKKGPQYTGMKHWQEKKKISKPTTPVKIDLASYTPFVPIDVPERDPQMIESEKRFNRMVDETRKEKTRINNSGLAGLMGGVKNGE